MKLALSFLLLVGSFWTLDPSSRLLETLSEEDRSALDWFFHNCAQSFGGYVLLGDKPMCVESFLNQPISLDLSESRIAKMRAFEILKTWADPQNPYLFLFCKYPHHGGSAEQHSHMIIINRKAFIRAVNDNLPLFRYVLGRTLTADTLLKELVEHQDRFWDTLKDDSVLIGILLGFGTSNSLIVSRSEEIVKSSLPEIGSFPYRHSQLANQPMLGFDSLMEERSKLSRMTVYSRDVVNTSSYHIPAFGCEPSSSETKRLLSIYTKNRNAILSECKKTDFLVRILSKILVKMPTRAVATPPLKTKNLTELFAELFSQHIFEAFPGFTTESHLLNTREVIDESEWVQSFLQGVEDAEKGSVLKNFSPFEMCELNVLPVLIDCCHNLMIANQYFKKVSGQKNWTSLIPNGIAYKTLRPGKGIPASSKLQTASLHVSYRLGSEQQFTHFETLNQAKISDLIPGVAQVLIGMKRGERRLVYIHPKYAYGITTTNPNATFIAEIQMNDFEEGEELLPLLAELDLEPTMSYMNDTELTPTPFPRLNLEKSTPEELPTIHKNLLNKYKHLLSQKMYFCGHQFWTEAKEAGIGLVFKDFYYQMTSNPEPKYLKNHEDITQFISDYKLSIFQKRFKEGTLPSFPRSWF